MREDGELKKNCIIKSSLVIVLCFGLCLAGCSVGSNAKKSDSGEKAFQAQPIPASEESDSRLQIAVVNDVGSETTTIKTAADPAIKTTTDVDTDASVDAAIDAAVDATADVASVKTKAIVTATSATTDDAVATTTVDITSASSKPTATINVIVSGKMLVFDEQQPVLKDGEVLVPVFGVFENLYGANGNKESPFSVNWDNQTSTATIKNRWYTVVAVSGEHDFTCNGNRVTPIVPQQMIDGVFMLPLTAIAQAIDATVEWGGGGSADMGGVEDEGRGKGESNVEGDQSKNTISIFYESMVMAG